VRLYSVQKIGRTGPKVLLVHGLYSSGGAWIPILKYFRGFQVTLITIDYHAAFMMNRIMDLVTEISSDLIDGYDFAVGHSFGACFLTLMGAKSNRNIYIAPSFLSSRFALKKYLDFICSAKLLNSAVVDTVVRQAIEINQSLEFALRINDKVLLPSLDEFFSYDDRLGSALCFCGGHSDIESAIDFAFSKNMIIC